MAVRPVNYLVKKKKKPKRPRVKPGDLLRVWYTADFRVPTGETNSGASLSAGEINCNELVTYVGPMMTFWNEPWAFVLTSRGLGWIRRYYLKGVDEEDDF